MRFFYLKMCNLVAQISNQLNIFKMGNMKNYLIMAAVAFAVVVAVDFILPLKPNDEGDKLVRI